MLRTYFVALASLAIVSSGAVAAETAAPQTEQAQTSSQTTAPATIVAKAEEDATPASDAPSATSEPAASTTEPAPSEKPAAAAAPAKPAPAPEPTLSAAINLSNQTITVSENGVAKYTWPISSGTQSHPSPRGTFRAQWTAKMWYSRKYDNAPMPHAVFVHEGVAIHATYATGMLGRPASHGCIRLSPTNAKTFYNLVQRHGVKNTRVSIYGTPKWGSDPYVASRKTKQRYAAVQQQDSGWDWFGTSSYSAPKPVYAPQAAYAKKRKGGPVYYYAQNGNVYLVKPKPVARMPGKKYYYNGYGYGYSSSNW